MQLFLQVFQPEREAKYEYKCKLSVNAQLHANSKLFFTFLNLLNLFY